MSDKPEAVDISVQNVQPGTADPAVAGAPAGADAAGNGYSETARTMDELRVKAPKVYKMMIKSLCMGMIHQMNTHAERLKKLNHHE